MKEFNIVNGVSTFEDTHEYLIRVSDREEDGIVGSCSNKAMAIILLECLAKAELKHLRKINDLIWTKTYMHFDEKELTYTITYQRLGHIELTNGAVKVYSTVYIEEIPRIFSSDYKHDIIVDGPYKSLEAELKDHPKVKQFVEDEY